MTVYATFPGRLTERAAEELTRALCSWDRTKPIVLQEGGRIGIVGGITLRAALCHGPLDQIEFDVHVDTLEDIPESLPFNGGTYVRWTTVDGVTMRTSSGGPCYRWEAA